MKRLSRRVLRRCIHVLATGSLWLGTLCPSARAQVDANCRFGSNEPLLRPTKVASASGNVQNAEALVEGHDGYATLTMAVGGTPPTVILDYGRDVGGLPVFEVSAVSGTPKLQAIYSESQQYLLPAGDGAPGFPNAPGAPSRVDTYPVNGPGQIVNHLVQGGERFEAITLAAPGTVTLRLVGIRSTMFRPPLSANRGSFRSSDSQLNEIWDLGAYTLLLDQLPIRSVPPLWTVTPQGVDVPYSPVALYQGGGGWADYTAAFDTQVVANEAAWVVRDNALVGYVVTLDADNDALNPPNTLRVAQTGLFGSIPVTSATLSFDLKPGTWHAVKTVAAGSQVSVYVDGRLITRFAVPITGFPSAATGSFGFQNVQGAEALFRNLSVVSSGGQTLYASALTNRSALDVFAAGTNPLPVILDGAKRDRLTFAGDLVLAAPTVYYTNGASDYVAGSLRLFGSFQRTNGEVSSVLSPLLKPGVVASDNLATANGGFYSLSYSIHFVNALHDYYFYTGNLNLAAALWSAVQGELAYLRSTVNPQANPQAPHLVTTDPSNGMDWNVNTQTGTVTEYNVLYYRALQNAAALAQVLGCQDEEAALTRLAALVKSEVNATLFDAATGLYDVSNLDRTTVAQDANALAVLYGVASSDRATSVLQALERALQTPHGPRAFSSGSGAGVISPFISGFDVYAHFQAGDAAGALSLIRTVWGQHMTHDKPFYSGAVFETLAENGTPESATRTLSHAWSSGPTSALSKYVLGVRPVQPGYQTWLIEPQPGDLSWAEGTVPTPYGPIAIAWQKISRGLRLEVWVPEGTCGTVGVPVNAEGALLIDNGQPVTRVSASKEPNGREGYLYLHDLQPGEHVIEAAGGKK